MCQRWGTELGVIQGIECLGPELHAEAVEEADILDQGCVQVIDSLRPQIRKALREGSNVGRQLLGWKRVERSNVECSVDQARIVVDVATHVDYITPAQGRATLDREDFTD